MSVCVCVLCVGVCVCCVCVLCVLGVCVLCECGCVCVCVVCVLCVCGCVYTDLTSSSALRVLASMAMWWECENGEGGSRWGRRCLWVWPMYHSNAHAALL